MTPCPNCHTPHILIGRLCFTCHTQAASRAHAFSRACLVRGCKLCRGMERWARDN